VKLFATSGLSSPGSENSLLGGDKYGLKIPESIPMITLVDGIHRTSEESLHPGEVLSVFPPVAGG
jgi:molybdopterin converting factor small subunit